MGTCSRSAPCAGWKLSAGNVEVMWLLSRLEPDYKSIAEFRRMHRDAVTETGAELVRLARSVGLVRGEWVAIDGFRTSRFLLRGVGGAEAEISLAVIVYNLKRMINPGYKRK